MVRSLVGSMLLYEAEASAGGSAAAERMELVLRSRDRSLAGPTAPAHGLFLWNVEYYSSPTRPGRGDYWIRGRDAEGESEPGPRLVPGLGPVDG
jgi:tRNA U38,U39,U40 pseudouridine synthase TruA